MAWVGTAGLIIIPWGALMWGLASDCKTGIMINCIKDNKYQSCYQSYREWRKLINVLVAQVSASLSDYLMIDEDWWDRERSYFTSWWQEVGFPNMVKYFHFLSVAERIEDYTLTVLHWWKLFAVNQAKSIPFTVNSFPTTIFFIIVFLKWRWHFL